MPDVSFKSFFDEFMKKRDMTVSHSFVCECEYHGVDVYHWRVVFSKQGIDFVYDYYESTATGSKSEPNIQAIVASVCYDYYMATASYEMVEDEFAGVDCDIELVCTDLKKVREAVKPMFSESDMMELRNRSPR